MLAEPEDRVGEVPLGRATEAELADECRELLDHPLVSVLLDSLAGFVLIVNRHRQVLAANAAFLDALALEDVETIRGLRPGEILRCIHPEEGPDGCGSTPACRHCGALIALLAAQSNGTPTHNTCFMTQRHGEVRTARTYRVQATPLRLGDHDFLVLRGIA